MSSHSEKIMHNSTFSEYSLREKGGSVCLRARVHARVCEGEGDNERGREIEN